MPRLYRESPVNAIWEGSGNVISLDVVRVLAKEPAAVDALRWELEESKGHDRRLDRAIDSAFADFAMGHAEARARTLTEGLALATAGSLLARHGSPEVFDAFAASRLAGDRGFLYGTLPSGLDLEAIVEPAVPMTAG